jgi:hypothetical protein
MKLSDFLSNVGRSLAFYPSLVKAIGNRNDAIFVCQMAYWKDKGETPNGWIYKESSEIEEETSLTYKEQINVRKRLKNKKILSEKYFRSEHLIYYKINWDLVNQIWEEYLKNKEAHDQRSGGTCPLVSSLNSNTYITSYNLPSQKNLCEGGQEENPVCKDCLKLQEDIAFIRSQGVKFEPMALRFEKQLADLKASNTCELIDEKRVEWAKEKDAPVSRESNIISAMFSGDEYADRVSIYPENVRKDLLLFVRKFEYPVSSIPKKSKSKGGSYATWILGVEELQNIAGKRFEEVLDKAHEIWYNRDVQYRNSIDMPQKLKSLFITALSELKKQDIEKMKEYAEKTKLAEEKRVAAPKQEEIEALKKFAKRLK